MSVLSAIISTLFDYLRHLNPLSSNLTKWRNTIKQFVARLPTNCLSVFDHFVNLAFKRLKSSQDLSNIHRLLYKTNWSIKKRKDKKFCETFHNFVSAIVWDFSFSSLQLWQRFKFPKISVLIFKKKFILEKHH